MIETTGSSNRGHGICCKMDYESGPCGSDESFTCSAAAEDIEPDSKYDKIQSMGNLNWQMFAWNPTTNHKSCAISNDETNFNMKLNATNQKQRIYSTSMKYRQGKPDYRRYDACYYEITAANSVLKSTGKNPKIVVKLYDADKISVYMY